MTNVIELKVEKRADKKPELLRKEGLVPAVVYGPADEPVSIQVPINEFLRVWTKAGESTIVVLQGLDEEKEVLIKDVQMHPVKELPIHIDFYAIERGKTLTLNVPLEFVGEAPAEKLGGIVVRVMHEVEVETRPRNIPQHLEVDLSKLTDLDSVILIKDIQLPEGVKILNDADETVASVSEQQEEPQEASTEENAVEGDAGDNKEEGNTDE